MSSLESIEVIIAPGQRAPRGKATLEAVFSYLGSPFSVWRKGQWRSAWGWMDLRKTRLDLGCRLAAACDVPDLELFPERYPGVQTVSFHAALEFGVQHLTLWCLAALRRIGLPFPVARWAVNLNRFAGVFDAGAGEKGGMLVSVVGNRNDGGGRMLRHIPWPLSGAPQMLLPTIGFPHPQPAPARVLNQGLFGGRRLLQSLQPLRLRRLPIFTARHAAVLRL
jgi:hypothetical protein